jgi:hypothetical protein
MKSFCRSCLSKHLVNELLNQSPLIDMKVGCPRKKVCFESVDTLKMNTQFTCYNCAGLAPMNLSTNNYWRG